MSKLFIAMCAFAVCGLACLSAENPETQSGTSTELSKAALACKGKKNKNIKKDQDEEALACCGKVNKPRRHLLCPEEENKLACGGKKHNKHHRHNLSQDEPKNVDGEILACERCA